MPINTGIPLEYHYTIQWYNSYQKSIEETISVLGGGLLDYFAPQIPTKNHHNQYTISQPNQNAEKFERNRLKTRGLGSGFRFGSGGWACA